MRVIQSDHTPSGTTTSQCCESLGIRTDNGSDSNAHAQYLKRQRTVRRPKILLDVLWITNTDDAFDVRLLLHAMYTNIRMCSARVSPAVTSTRNTSSARVPHCSDHGTIRGTQGLLIPLPVASLTQGDCSCRSSSQDRIKKQKIVRSCSKLSDEQIHGIWESPHKHTIHISIPHRAHFFFKFPQTNEQMTQQDTRHVVSDAAWPERALDNRNAQLLSALFIDSMIDRRANAFPRSPGLVMEGRLRPAKIPHVAVSAPYPSYSGS